MGNGKPWLVEPVAQFFGFGATAQLSSYEIRDVNSFQSEFNVADKRYGMACIMRLSVSVILFLFFRTLACFALEPHQVWERANGSVVRVEATLLDGEIVTGSGFVYEISGKKKCILSNRHVVAGAKSVRVGHKEEDLVPTPGYRISATFDLAIIDFPSRLSIAPLKMRKSEIKTGERVYAIGFPLGLNKSITQGLVSSQTDELLQFDAPISSGNSGGPLVDKDGLVVGVVTAGSIPSEHQIVQNLNFAIKSAVIPQLNLFEDPIISFFEAWRELVAIETKLLDGIAKHRVLEIHDYLSTEMGYAILGDEQVRQEAFRYPATAEKSLNQTWKVLETARHELPPLIPSAIRFLKDQQAVFDRIPDLFVGLGRNELLKQFTRDQRPRGFFRFRLNISETEIVPLLKSSLEHVKARYEDMAYQIDYLAGELAKLQERDPGTLTRLLEENSRKRKQERRDVRLDYGNLEQKSEAERLSLFVESLITYEPPDEDPSMSRRAFEGKLTTSEFFRRGGMVEYLIAMFHELAVAEALKGNVKKAIGYIQNDFTYRRFGPYRLLGHFSACKGDFEAAYELYEKAFFSANSRTNVDAFRLKIDDGGLRRVLILNDLLENGADLYNTAEIRRNLTEFHRFLQSKPPFIVMRLPWRDAIKSKVFRNGSEFERLFVLRALELRDPFNDEFKAAVNADPLTAAVYNKYWETR